MKCWTLSGKSKEMIFMPLSRQYWLALSQLRFLTPTLQLTWKFCPFHWWFTTTLFLSGCGCTRDEKLLKRVGRDVVFSSGVGVANISEISERNRGESIFLFFASNIELWTLTSDCCSGLNTGCGCVTLSCGSSSRNLGLAIWGSGWWSWLVDSDCVWWSWLVDSDCVWWSWLVDSDCGWLFWLVDNVCGWWFWLVVSDCGWWFWLVDSDCGWWFWLVISDCGWWSWLADSDWGISSLVSGSKCGGCDSGSVCCGNSSILAAAIWWYSCVGNKNLNNIHQYENNLLISFLNTKHCTKKFWKTNNHLNIQLLLSRCFIL